MNKSNSLWHPLAVVHSLTDNWSLVVQFVRREVAGRYKGSFLGLFWSFVTPLVMLSIYTFVFGFVFKSRWRTGSTDHMEFAVVMFAGVIMHSLISECIQRGPMLVVGNPNYVKKVVFPLQTLPWIAIGSALFHMLVASLILLVAIVAWQGHLPWTVLYAPLMLVPFLVLTAGLLWMLASVGVFMRDLGQMTGVLSSVLMFSAPVFYPLSSVPERLQGLILLNPLTFVIGELRNVAIWGLQPNWMGWLIYSIVAYGIASLGLLWFQKTRKGFADVL